MVEQRLRKRVSKRLQERKLQQTVTRESGGKKRRLSTGQSAGSHMPKRHSSSSRSPSEPSSEHKEALQDKEARQYTRENQITSARATGGTEDILKTHLVRLLYSREYPKTICPSEIPRALSRAELDSLGVSHWRELMDSVRALVFKMQDNRQVEILQKAMATLNAAHAPNTSNNTSEDIIPPGYTLQHPILDTDEFLRSNNRPFVLFTLRHIDTERLHLERGLNKLTAENHYLRRMGIVEFPIELLYPLDTERCTLERAQAMDLDSLKYFVLSLYMRNSATVESQHRLRDENEALRGKLLEMRALLSATNGVVMMGNRS
ncbi:MAG: hypothetical protein Q9208_008649 [Pyrenodesmia sp. 3 TL-2023]